MAEIVGKSNAIAKAHGPVSIKRPLFQVYGLPSYQEDSCGSQIIGNSTACSTVQANYEQNIKPPHYWPLCEGNPSVTDGFPPQRASDADRVSKPWRQPTNLKLPSRFALLWNSQQDKIDINTSPDSHEIAWLTR